MNTQTLRDIVQDRFGGVVTEGPHEPGGAANILEARSVWLGIRWTDDPRKVGMPDIRPLNDANWPDDEIRTRWMLDLHDALNDWAKWGRERQRRFAQALALRTTRELLPPTLRAVLPHGADACGQAETLGEAEMVAAVAAEMVAREVARRRVKAEETAGLAVLSDVGLLLGVPGRTTAMTALTKMVATEAVTIALVGRMAAEASRAAKAAEKARAEKAVAAAARAAATGASVAGAMAITEGAHGIVQALATLEELKEAKWKGVALEMGAVEAAEAAVAEARASVVNAGVKAEAALETLSLACTIWIEDAKRP